MPDRNKSAVGGNRRRRGRWLTLLASTAFLVGVVVIIIAVATQQHAPEPNAAAYGTVASNPKSTPPTPPADRPTSPHQTTTAADPDPGSATPGAKSPHASITQAATTPRPTANAALPASKPVHITIPAIGVDSRVFAIGKDPHGGLQVPQPGPNLNNVAWYENSPTPGQTGPAVLEGHVDTLQGPSVFLRLGALVPGNKVRVTRADGTTVIFTVNAVRAYKSHGDFPTDLVYGGDLTSPTLRIITCSNFDHSTGHYVGNTIVFAHLTGSHH